MPQELIVILTVAINAHPVPMFAALALGIGSLGFYLVGAIISRISGRHDKGSVRRFSLALPPNSDYVTLFAISLVSAQTPLSTVFVFFLVSGGTWGARLFLCPVFFTVGCWLLLHVYQNIAANGYFTDDHGGLGGMLPWLSEALTGSRAVSVLTLLLCALPLLSLLALELRYGIEIIYFLLTGSNALSNSSILFSIYALLIILLLGYVFVGGFRAVVTSDVYQYKLIKLGASIAVTSFVILFFRNPHSFMHSIRWTGNSKASSLAFYVPVIMANLFAPMSLAVSWQRFRAFRAVSTDFRKGIRHAVTIGSTLWLLLAIIGLFVSSGDNTDLKGAFDTILRQGSWFGLVVFPLLIVAALSAMYSASDTCVSALLFFLEFGKQRSSSRNSSVRGLRPARSLAMRHYLGMSCVLAITLLVFKFTAAYQADLLFRYAATLFGGAIIIAPLILVAAVLEPARTNPATRRLRTAMIVISFVSGMITFWTCAGIGFYVSNDILIYIAVFPAFVVASIPAFILVIKEKTWKGLWSYVFRTFRSRNDLQSANALGR